MDPVTLYVKSSIYGHSYDIRDGDGNLIGYERRIRITTTSWDKDDKLVSTDVVESPYAVLTGSPATGPSASFPIFQPPPPSLTEPVDIVPAQLVDSYVVPNDPQAPGYLAGREGQRCFVLHRGLGVVRFEYCGLQLALAGNPAPDPDVAASQLTVNVTGGAPLARVQVDVGLSGRNPESLASAVTTQPPAQATLPGLVPRAYTVRAWEYARPYCRTELPATVPGPPPLVILATPEGPAATGGTGNLEINIDGGFQPRQLTYQFLPAGGGTPAAPLVESLAVGSVPYSRYKKLLNLAPGRYAIVVTDGNGATASEVAEVPPPPPDSCHLDFNTIAAIAPALGEKQGAIRISVKQVGTGHTVRATLLRGNVVVTGPQAISTTNYYTFANLDPSPYYRVLIEEMVGLTTPTNPPCRKTSGNIVVPEPPPSHFSFLPWVRQRLARQAAVAANTLRPSIALAVQARVTTGTAVTTMNSSSVLEITGPGDIVGFNYEAVLKTTPGAGEQRFSPLELASIEFRDEDLPWRYSPVAISATTNQAVPWCLLLTLEETEYQLLAQENRPLPAVRVKAGPLFPAATALWPWAHVQANKQLLSPAGVAPATPPADVAEQFLNRELPLKPSLAFSRVLSARRLKPNTRYRALLLPTFETGRLAGLGQPVAAAAADTLAWAGKADGTDLDFPIYHQWEFQTGQAENFESLARLLRPVAVAATNPVRVAVRLPSTAAATKLALPTVIEVRNAPAASPPAAVVTALYTALQPGFASQSQAAGARPVVTPPLYGRSYADAAQLTSPTNGVIPAGWKHTANLDPRYRAIANLGSGVVRDQQEELMNRAWAQVKDLVAVNHNLRSLQFSLQVAAGLRGKHLPLLDSASSLQVARPATAARRPPDQAAQLEERPYQDERFKATTADDLQENPQQGEQVEEPEGTTEVTVDGLENYGLQLAALAQARTRDPGTGLTVREAVRRSDVPQAVFSPAFRRIMRPFGRYLTGLAGRPLRPSQPAPDTVPETLLAAPTGLRQRDALLSLLQAGVLQAAPPKPAAMRTYQFADSFLDAVLDPATKPPTALRVWEEGAEYRVVTEGEALAAFRQAYEAFRQPADKETLTFVTPQELKPPLALDTLKDQVVAATAPERVLTARTQQAIAQPARTAPGDLATADFSGSDFAVNATPARPDAVVAGDAEPAGFQRAAAGPTRSRVSLAGLFADPTLASQLKPVMAYPVFRDAMGELLQQQHPELFVPDLENFPANGVALLQLNRKVIEAYMLGLNHAFGSELLWRQYPTDLRGSYFQQFWDVSEYVNTLPPDNLTPRQREEKYLDVRALDQWGTRALGANPQPQAPGPGLVLAIRAELLRRFPNTVICLQPARAVAGSNPTRWEPDPEHTQYPLGRLNLGADILALTFAITEAQLRSSATPGGYFFVFMERPGEPRFGLDELAPPRPAGTALPNPTDWNDLSWEYMQTTPGSNLEINPTAKPQAQTGAIQHVATSAQLAYALLREPALVAIPALALLPAATSDVITASA